jgi:phosphoglycolate phosphatase-like HAD superfamily hydrolase
MLDYFSLDRISTYDEAEAAEIELNLNGQSKKLGKPHPYMFARSIFPEKSTKELADIENRIPNAEQVLIVGDAQADLWPAQTMGCRSAAVLSGAIGKSAKKELEVANPDVICHDMIELTEALVQLKTTGDLAS